METLTIVSYYTERYAYALKAQARRLKSNLSDIIGKYSINYVACTDDSNEAAEGFDFIKATLNGVNSHRIIIPNHKDNNLLPYKEDAQLLIAQMTQAVLDKARELNSDYVWMLEADILPAPNAIRCLLDVLSFDNGYYQVAFAPYTSNGGGSFMGGFGSPTQQIFKDFLPEDRMLTEEQQKRLSTFKDEELAFQTANTQVPQEWVESRLAFEQEIEKCSIQGSIWELIAKRGWRRRGWLDFAYPAIAKGMVVPIDWCGTGCTLITKDVLSVSHLDGYSGKGTQDLFLVWNRWYPNKFKIGLTTQALCDHVIRVREENGTGKRTDKIVHIVAYYETQGEAKDHIRWKPTPWFASDFGETVDPLNDGVLQQIPNLNQIDEAKNEEYLVHQGDLSGGE